LNDRLSELGYPEDLDRSSRVRLGNAAVEAYKRVHGGKGPAMAEDGRQGHAKRVALYEAADLPLVDAVIVDIMGEVVPADVVVGAEE
jgi:hypothetical protein